MREFGRKFRKLRLGGSKKPSASGPATLDASTGAPSTTSEASGTQQDSTQSPSALVPSTEAPTTSEASEAQQDSIQNPSAPTPSTDGGSPIQSEVWNEAYDALKEDEPGVVDAYERILSGQLKNNTPATEVKGYPENVLKSATVRQDQLKSMIEEGQARTKRAEMVKGKSTMYSDRSTSSDLSSP